MVIKSAAFLKSSKDFSQFPPPNKIEIAVIGRSNVGKSSLINMITQRRNLAKTSSTPGKTQLINHFDIDDTWYLVDLPGYGWAKASKADKAAWKSLVDAYLLKRDNLILTMVLIDIRHMFHKGFKRILHGKNKHASKVFDPHPNTHSG